MLPLRHRDRHDLVSKKEVFFYHLIDSSIKVDIVGTESWLKPDIHDNKVFPPGYIVYRWDRDGHGGGMFVMVKDNIISSCIEDLELECEIVWVKIEIASCKPLYIASYYRPNNLNAESLEQLEVSLDKLPQ